MEVFSYILLNNIAPIFVIIFLGYLLAKKFKLDINSLSKIYFYFFVPALMFVKLYETEIKLELINVVWFGGLMIIIQGLISRVISLIRGHSASMTNALTNSLILYNSGNFGLPLVMLVFRDTPYFAYAVSIQIIILMVQNLATNTLGFYFAGRGQLDLKENLIKILRLPSIYAIILALIIKNLPFDVRGFFLWPAIEYAQNGLVPVALLALGTQLYYARFTYNNIDVYIASLVRLLGGPFLAFLLIKIMGISGVMAQALLVSSSVPTAINTALIAVEFNNEPDFASQVVLTTTVFCSITLVGVIYLSSCLF